MLPPLLAKDFDDALETIIKTNIHGKVYGAMTPGLSSPMVQQVIESNYKKIFNSDPATKMGIFNDLGFRSDDFITNHNDNLHVLYAGCSFTYAEGVPIDLSWSSIVHEYINKNIQQTSGYFNVGKSGAQFSTIINNIMGYIKFSGVPDMIFINLPDIGRERLEYDTPVRLLHQDRMNRPKYLRTIISLHERLINFKIMCDAMNIKLFLGSWSLHSDVHRSLTTKFMNPYQGLGVIDVTNYDEYQGPGEISLNGIFVESDRAKKEVLDKINNDVHLSQILNLALDDAHPGLIGHHIMAEKFIKALRPLHD